MKTRILLAVLVGLVLPLVGGSTAGATDASGAAYVSNGAWGVLTVSAPEGSCFQVWGEQADGTYAQVAGGVLPEGGSTVRFVPQAGLAADFAPQFFVVINGANGHEVLAVSDPLDKWWLD